MPTEQSTTHSTAATSGIVQQPFPDIDRPDPRLTPTDRAPNPSWPTLDFPSFGSPGTPRQRSASSSESSYLPKRAFNLTIEWAIEHRAELIEDWNPCQAKQQPKKIQPLE